MLRCPLIHLVLHRSSARLSASRWKYYNMDMQAGEAAEKSGAAQKLQLKFGTSFVGKPPPPPPPPPPSSPLTHSFSQLADQLEQQLIWMHSLYLCRRRRPVNMSSFFIPRFGHQSASQPASSSSSPFLVSDGKSVHCDGKKCCSLLDEKFKTMG